MEGRDLFVPIVGERVDAHRFICQAISAGAETVFTSCHHSEKEVREAIESQCREHPEWSGQALLSTWICVEDTKAALQALGAWCRSQAQIPLVGITGSVGKTTTREMVACALSAGYRFIRRRETATAKWVSPSLFLIYQRKRRSALLNLA